MKSVGYSAAHGTGRLPPSVAARIRQLEAERDYRRSVAEYRAEWIARREARLADVLDDLIGLVAETVRRSL